MILIFFVKNEFILLVVVKKIINSYERDVEDWLLVLCRILSTGQGQRHLDKCVCVLMTLS